MRNLRPVPAVPTALAHADEEPPLDDLTRRLQAIAEAQQELAAAEIRDGSAMRVVCERVSRLVGADGAVLLLVEGDRLRQRAHHGLCSLADGETIALEGSLGGWAFHANKTAVCNDTHADPRIAPAVQHRLGDIRSMLALPMRRRELPVGCLMVIKRAAHAFNAADVYTGELLTVLLAASLAQASEVETLARFEATYKDAPTGIFMIGLDGRPFDWNPAAAELLGYDELELRTMRFVDAVDPDERAAIETLFSQVIEGRLERFRHEIRLVRCNGSTVWGKLGVSAVHDAAGRPRFVVALAEDVTQQRVAEEQLRQVQKMDAIGQLTAGIAHDFNNLLMGVLGYTELLRATTEPATPSAEYIQRIERSASRAAKLTQQLLAFGRQQTLEPREIDLNGQVYEAVSMLRRVLGEHIEIAVDLAADLARLCADPTQIHQVLLNLALNARDAMPDGGKLWIETANAMLDDGDTPAVRLTVADTGCGIPPEMLARIFDPFFTTKEVGAGSGLGLSSVYGIIKQSGGEIAVASNVGEGTTFTIRLPALPD